MKFNFDRKLSSGAIGFKHRVREVVRMHCKIVFNFALRHRLAFSCCQTRKALIGLSNLDPIGQWAESNCFCETQTKPREIYKF